MKKLAIVFPGQGTQYMGMGKKLYDAYQVARDVYDEAEEALKFNFKYLCFEENHEELRKTYNGQPAILATSVALYRVYMQEIGIEPDYVAGHSIGEYSALTCAGVLSLSDAVCLVRKRGTLMQQAAEENAGVMAAVNGASIEVINEVCKECTTSNELVVISNYNTRQQNVISGNQKAVEKAAKKLKEYGARVIFLNVSGAFHCPLMDSAYNAFKEELTKYHYNDFRYPIISNTTGKPYLTKEEIPIILGEQLIKPVQWQKTMEYLKSQDVGTIIDIGPQAHLRNMVAKSIDDVKAFAYEKEDDAKAVKKYFNIEGKIKNDYHMTIVSKSMAIAVCLKNYNDDNEAYEEGVVGPYRRVKTIYEGLEKDKREPNMEEMQEALEMLVSVFNTKKTPEEERVSRIEELFKDTGTEHLKPKFKLAMEGLL